MILLFVAAISFFFVLSWLINLKQKSFKIHQLLNKDVKKKSKKKSKGSGVSGNLLDIVFSLKPIKKFSPSSVISEARKVEWELSYSKYQVIIFTSGIVISSVLFIYFKQSVLSLIGFAVAFVLPRILLHYKRKKYTNNMNDRLTIYMKTMANSMSVLGNVVDSLNETIKLVHPSLKDDLIKAMTLLQAGKRITEAFEDLCKKYDYKDFVFFHEILEVTHDSGHEYIDVLVNIAEDYEQRKYLQAKLNGALGQAKQAYIINSIIFLSLPLVFYFLQRQAYNMLMSSLIGPTVIVLFTVILTLVFVKIEKMSSLESFKDF